MESFNSAWIGEGDLGDLGSEYFSEPVHIPIANLAANSNYADSDSPQLSGDSQECLNELTLKSKKSEKNVVKFNITNTALAKKRLQAYSQQIHKIPIKDEKIECKEQRQDLFFKRKKDSTEKAKTVIQQIEEEKRKEFALGKIKQMEDDNIRHLLATTVIPNYFHQSVDHHLSRESTEQFRRREIKQRNYRRTDSGNSRNSASPEVHHHKSKARSSPLYKNPKNWSEYNANKYDDKPTYKNHSKNKPVKNILDNLYSFHLPSPYIESFRFDTSENEIKEISPFFLRRTKSQPSVIYSVNFEKNKESFLTRDQLFQLVSEERQQAIKNVISSHSKLQPLNKMVESKSWYNKTWRKHTDAECKILENSVGLSFLQTYSDEEEEEENETEEILICSSINNVNNSKIEQVPNDSFRLTKEIDKSYDEVEVIITSESQDEELQIKNNTFEENDANPTVNVSTVPEDETGILTPEIPLQLQKSFSRTESNDLELENQKEIEETINETKSKPKIKKKKTAKKKTESSPKKKNKKKKRKRKSQSSVEQPNSSEEDKKKKKVKRKKSKDKKEKASKNKKETKKTSSSKDLKSKKKDKLSEQLDIKDKNAKKKKKETENVETKSPMLDDLRKQLKKKKKMKKESRSGGLDTEELRNENRKHPDKNDKPDKLDKSDKHDKPDKHDKDDKHDKYDKHDIHVKHDKDDKHDKYDKHDIHVKHDKDDKHDKYDKHDIHVKHDKDDKHDKYDKYDKHDIHVKHDKRDEHKTIDLIAINKSYRRSLDLGTQEKLNLSNSETDRSKTPIKSKKREFDDEFTVQKDIFIDCLDARTPDTNEYKGNWERDSFESIEENLLVQTKLNTSWESDDDIYEKQERPNEHLRNYCEVSNFEIPLNIKPFKKRDLDALKMKIDEKIIPFNLPAKETSRRLDKFKIDAEELKKPSRRIDEFKIDTPDNKKTSKKIDEFKMDTVESKKTSRKTNKFKLNTEETKKTLKRIDEFKIDTEDIKETSKTIDEFKIDARKTKRTSRFDKFEIDTEKIKESLKTMDEFKIDVEETKKKLIRPDEFKIDAGETKKTSRRLDKLKIDDEEFKETSKTIDEFKIDVDETKKTLKRTDEFKIDAGEIKRTPRRFNKLKIDTEESKETKTIDDFKINVEETKKKLKRTDEFKIDAGKIKRTSIFDKFDIDTEEIKETSKTMDAFKIDVEETKKKLKSTDEFKIDAGKIKRTSRFDKFDIDTEVIKETSKIMDEFKIDVEETKKKLKSTDEFKIDAGETKRASRRFDKFEINTEEIKETSKIMDAFKIDVEETKKKLKSTDECKIDAGETKRTSRRFDKFEINTEEIKETLKTMDEFKIDVDETKKTLKSTDEFKTDAGETKRTPRRFDKFQIDTEDIFSMNLSIQETSDINIEEPKLENIIPKVPQKKRRWDKTERESTPNSTLKTNNSTVTSLNSSLNSSSLEHEYVEFMKAVTSNTDSLSSSKIDDSVISVSSNESVEILDSISLEKIQASQPLGTQKKPECVISPKDIPFIPMPDEVKPVPVPCPVVENISKPLISFNLSTSIFTALDSPIISQPKKPLESPVFSENVDFYADNSSQAILDDVSSSNILLEAASKEEEVIMEAKNISSPIKQFTFPTLLLPAKEAVSEKEEEEVPKEIKNVSSPTKPFTFTTLVLPTKKTLLDNSNLKLCDSDDETDNTMKPIDEIRREHLIESDVKGSVQTEQTFDIELAIKIPKRKEPVIEQKPIQQKSLSPPPKIIQSDNVKSEKRNVSPKRSRKRESSPKPKTQSPKRESSPKRRKRSPERYRDRDRERDRKRKSSGGRRYSSRRTRSPSYSPRRRSPKRSISPRGRSSTKSSSKNTDKYVSNSKKPKHETSTAENPRQKSPTIASPLEGLKRSVADSTISDDSLLPQPNLEEYTQSPLPQFFNSSKPEEKRISLDDRINLELGWHKEELQPISTTYESYNYNRNQFLQAPPVFSPNPDQKRKSYSNANASSNFVQVGNMVQIVPKDLTEMDDLVQHGKKSQILQVGNMIQIVPNEMAPEIPLPPLPKSPPKEDPPSAESTLSENVSSDLDQSQNVCERRAERDKRKKDRETRRKEKENRRREKEKERNVKMKEKTENMIMRALQLEVENNDEVESDFNESACHWPPSLNASGSKDVLNKSILVQGRRRSSKCKNVQFADGIRPGDGTSPSAGEDLCSPPPSKVLPKEKRYTRTKLRNRNMKKKVKVKIIKHNPEQTHCEDGVEDEDDHLPPPSPPPGSPPPHIFPPRIKTIINTMQAYIPNVLGNQNQPVYTTTMNHLMTTQSLSRLQQFNIPGGQAHVPTLPESHIPVHHLAHYPLSSVVAPPPPPVVTSDSSFGITQRNPHLYKYTH